MGTITQRSTKQVTSATRGAGHFLNTATVDDGAQLHSALGWEGWAALAMFQQATFGQALFTTARTEY